VRERAGRTFYVSPPYDPGIEKDLRTHFEGTYTISFDNYPVAPDYLPHSEVIPVG
jgi:formylmethanofuran dehydrogenase subunit A